jgi:ParB/RepB/Spo0J family partition protein
LSIPLNKIVVVSGRNLRSDFGDLDELAKQIAQNGQKVPGLVRISSDGNHVELVDGERRFKSIKLANEKYGAKIETFICRNEEKGSNEESRTMTMLLCGVGSKPLEPLEEAEGYKRLIDYNWTVDQIAEKMGKSKHYVEERLALNGAPHDVRQSVQEGTLSPTAATKLAKAPEAKRKEVMEKAKGKTTKKGKKKKVSISDVEKATKGRSAMISSGSILKKKKVISERMKEVNELYAEHLQAEKIAYYKAVILGLDLALDEVSLDEI